MAKKDLMRYATKRWKMDLLKGRNMAKGSIKTFLMALFMVALAAMRTLATEPVFYFELPRIPVPPVIRNVSNTAPIPGTAVTVYAQIEGQSQSEDCCEGVCRHECAPNCDFSACALNGFYGEPDPTVFPNPVCIPNNYDSSQGAATAACMKPSMSNPRLYYYFLDDPSNTVGVTMYYDHETGKFKGEIPKSTMDLFSEGDGLSYYIVASDNMGNVVSQTPSATDVPCVSSSLSAWVSSLSTPAINNCSAMNSYERCGVRVNGTPSCGAQYTVNDPGNDTCDMGGAVDASLDQRDILGFSAGVADNQVCTFVKLDAAAPDIGDNSEEIVMYIMTYINNDVPDPNPDDLYMPNATIITYAPGMAGIEPNLVSVLWDGECLTNANTPDILSCKSIVGGEAETRLIINSSSTLKSILFMANNHLANGKTIAGATSKSVTQIAQTGVLRFDGGTPYWTVDTSPALKVINKQQNMVLSMCGPFNSIPAKEEINQKKNSYIEPYCSSPSISAPLADEFQTCINGDGTVFVNGRCEVSAMVPSSNVCRLTVKPSREWYMAGDYRIYRAETDNVYAALRNGEIGRITENLGGINIYDDVITELEGQNYYYFFSSKSDFDYRETDPERMTRSICAVEDSVQPAEPPRNLVCAAPEGTENRCRCQWTTDTVADPSIRKFRVMRDGAMVTDSIAAVAGVTQYEKTDFDSSIVAGQSYSYSVTAIDVGNNESPVATATCVAEDLKAPEKVSDFRVFPFQGDMTLDARFQWEGVDDASYYNVYKCASEWRGISCVTYPHANWTKVNSEPVSHLGRGAEHEFMAIDVPGTGGADFNGEYCFWIEACDDCVAAGTCGKTEPNCSTFNYTSKYTVCAYVTSVPDSFHPAVPQNVVSEALSEGGKCRLTWDRVTTQSTGEPFDNTNNPSNVDLMGYAVMSAPQGEPVPSSPFLSDPVAWVPKSSHPEYTNVGLVNGATYQYYVIAFDSSSNYSTPQNSEITCSPADAEPPSAPGISVEALDFSASVLSWTASQDSSSPVTYTVHRCHDIPENCDTTDDFPSNWGDNLGAPFRDITELTLIDTDVDFSGGEYTYCVTAKDAAGNESALFEGAESAAGAGNCQVTITSVESPSNANVSFNQTNSSGVALLTYEDSPTFGRNQRRGGHNIYYCDDVSCAVKTRLNGAPETADHRNIPYEISYCDIEEGQRYVGVTYDASTGMESAIAVADTKLFINHDMCPDMCLGSACINNRRITIPNKFMERRLVPCDSSDPDCETGVVKAVEVPFEGSTIRLVNILTNEIVKESLVNNDGYAPDFLLDETESAENLKVVLHMPAASYGGYFRWCENVETAAAEGCDIVIDSQQEPSGGSVIEEIYVSRIRPAEGESQNSFMKGGGGEIGNANGDRKINIGDVTEMKKAYNSVKGDRCYAIWADFDLNGKVNLADMAILRKNYNTVIPVDEGETFEPTLTSANPEYAIPACCATKTCQ